MSEPQPESSRICIQVVLYESALEAILQLVRSVVVATQSLEEHLGRKDMVSLRLGDCSSTPSFTPQEQNLVLGEAHGAIRDASYTFFNANLGSAGGSNRLAETAASEYLLILNPDTVIDPDLLIEFVGRFGEDPSIGSADARQLPLEHPKDYSVTTGDTTWASGACMFVRRSVFELVEGFSADIFPLYCDDVDLSWKVRSAGFRVIHVPSARVFHDKRLTTDAAVEASETETISSALARLKLTLRWGRPDLHKATLNWLVRQPAASAHYRAGEEWHRLVRSQGPTDELPDVSAAQFIEGEYAVHRF